jgi:hypothetical protein
MRDSIYLKIEDKSYIKRQLKKSININLVEDAYKKANDNNGSQN